MSEKQETNNCVHQFEYVRKEQEASYGVANWKEVDVVICTKCGEVRRKPA